MLQRMINDVSDSAASALQQMGLAAAVALAAFIAISFLCAAAFVYTLDTYGPVQACLAGALIFLIVALATGGWYVINRRQIEVRAALRAQSAPRSLLADPVVVSTGLQIARVIGAKRLILLAVGGIALGLMTSRNQTRDEHLPNR